MTIRRTHPADPEALERPLERSLADRLIDHMDALTVGDLANAVNEVLGRVVDHVMTSELERDALLFLRTHGADDGRPEVAGPRTQQMTHAARSRMNEYVVTGLHSVRLAQQK